MLKVGQGRKLDSPLLVRKKKGKMVPMTAAYMRRMDKKYATFLGWSKATIHSPQRRIGTAAVRCGIYMGSITIAMLHATFPRGNYAACYPVPGRKGIHFYSFGDCILQKMKLVHRKY